MSQTAVQSTNNSNKNFTYESVRRRNFTALEKVRILLTNDINGRFYSLPEASFVSQ